MTTEPEPDAQIISDDFSGGVATESDIIVLPENEVSPEPKVESRPELLDAVLRRYDNLEETP